MSHTHTEKDRTKGEANNPPLGKLFKIEYGKIEKIETKKQVII